MASEILRFTEKPVIDESVQEYQFHEYEPQARTNHNSAGEIVINIELQDLFTHPCESYLVFEGRLTKDNGNPYANADAVTLINNGMMYLFSSISYRLSSSSSFISPKQHIQIKTHKTQMLHTTYTKTSKE